MSSKDKYNLNFCLMSVEKGGSYDQTGFGDLLCYVEKGYFASNAWLQGDVSFETVLGRSFGVRTSDDNLSYKVDRNSILPISNDLVIEMMEYAHPDFKKEFMHLTKNVEA